MNKIAFHLLTYTEIDQDDYLVVETQIDDESIVDFRTYATDVHELIGSGERSGSFFILTCWCGDPGCAGIMTSINVRHVLGNVYWNLVQPAPERTFVFPRAEYDQAIKNLLKDAQEYIDQHQHSTSRRLEITPDRNATLFVSR